MWTHSWLEKEKRENVLATAAPSVTQRSRSTPWHRHVVKQARVLLSGGVNSDSTSFIKPLGSRLKAAGRGCWWMWAERGAAKHTHTPSWSLRFQLCNCASVCVCVTLFIPFNTPRLSWHFVFPLLIMHSVGVSHLLWYGATIQDDETKKKTAELRQHTPDNVRKKKKKKEIIKFRTKTAKIKKIINDFTI